MVEQVLAAGRFHQAAPVLLGAARGKDVAPVVEPGRRAFVEAARRGPELFLLCMGLFSRLYVRPNYSRSSEHLALLHAPDLIGVATEAFTRRRQCSPLHRKAKM